MTLNYKYAIPSLIAVVLTASAALAQLPPANSPRGPARTPPTAEQMAARQSQRCADMKASGDARLTYMEERLNLTAAQKPLFDRWKAAVQAQDATRQADCAKPRPAPAANAARPTLPERNARMEDMLKARLADLEKMRPAQEALYNALTDDQKKLFEGGRMSQRGRGPGGGFGGRGRGPGGPGFGPGGFGPRGGARGNPGGRGGI